MSDELLLKGCMREDPRFQQALYDRYKVEMFMLCLRYSRNRAEAEDLLQDGYVQVFRDLHQFDASKGSLQGWIRRVVLNKVLQHLRKKRIQFANADVNDFANLIPSTNDNIISILSAKELVQLIQQLPEGYRTVFNLYMMEGYSHQEIADNFGISVSTSKTQLHKAKLALQQKVTNLVQLEIHEQRA